MEVLTDCRYLGAHVNVTARMWNGTTLTNCILQAADETERLNRVKAPSAKEAAIARPKRTPEALQGC